ncbi:MAG: DUF885 family protein [Rhodothermales bacterium]|nr:DUF885 family protein [Rhodothermales bacterium]MBO6779352.1 DUF885 family protein [Rhodothermales bacterium]
MPRLLALLLLLSVSSAARAQAPALQATPDLNALAALSETESDLRLALERYGADRSALLRRYDVPLSPVRRLRMTTFYRDWLEALDNTAFAALNHEGQVDYVLLRNRLEFELEMLAQESDLVGAMAPLLPFARELEQLQEARRDRQPVEARATADQLHRIAGDVQAAEAALADMEPVKGVLAARAARHVRDLARLVRGWFGFHNGYDPLFTWWVPRPHERLQEALASYASAVESRFIGDLATGPVIGDPIGAEGLAAHLKHEMIPYSADELIAIAEAEFAWMEEALVEAAREMGYGDDWRAAQEAVKNLAVPPGEKPGVVLDLEQQSIDFIKARDWITLPPLAHEVWRMEMMSPERQRVAPFFLGGEVIQVSYPTDEMEHDEKLMSMRGNNPHFNRATVHHELIPGHHLQGFMTRRFNAHRSMFSTPFWGEGWALYWEMVLWDAGFPRGPEDRIGMLFWRMHRAARIIFSLSFHLERMTPQEAVDFLVGRVGHERANAEAEVRRSFAGNYSPLYQVGYMMGGMQFRALYREMVDSGAMTSREFHDAVMLGGRMPVEMVRARLTGQALTRNHETAWRFMD